MADLSADSPAKKEKKQPKWIVTFADLMSLLLTFFILLLTFAEIDATKFRKISGSLKMAFGVQRVNVFDEAPKGTSFIQQEFRPGSPDSIPMGVNASGLNLEDPQLRAIKNKQRKAAAQRSIQREKELERNANKVYKKLAQEVKEGKVELTRSDDGRLFISVAEDATFSKNKTKLSASSKKLLEKISNALLDVDGKITVAGHTDDKKIKTPRFPSNWDFSAARALTLGKALIELGGVDEDRVTIQAHGATQPLVRNNSKINRKKNRRIEIILSD